MARNIAKYGLYLLRNSKILKKIRFFHKLDSAYINFNSMIAENNDVKFEKQYVRVKYKIKPVKYEIAILKRYLDEGDEPRIVRDELGRLVKEDLVGGMLVVDRALWKVEEVFTVYINSGKDYKRLKYEEIEEIFLRNRLSKNDFFEVYVINNKVVKFSDSELVIVLCKTKEDAIRLYKKIEKSAKSRWNKSLVFTGVIEDPYAKLLKYDLLMELTGWSFIKIRKNKIKW
jgi:hypothetical protein